MLEQFIWRSAVKTDGAPDVLIWGRRFEDVEELSRFSHKIDQAWWIPWVRGTPSFLPSNKSITSAPMSVYSLGETESPFLQHHYGATGSRILLGKSVILWNRGQRRLKNTPHPTTTVGRLNRRDCVRTAATLCVEVVWENKEWFPKETV